MSSRAPKSVICVVIILALALCFGIVQMLRFVSQTDFGITPAVPYGTVMALYFALGFLVYKIARGKDWARMVYSVILVIGFLRTAIALPDLLATSSASNLGLFIACAKVVALVLLYVPASNAWFRRDSSNNSFKPKPLRGSA